MKHDRRRTRMSSRSKVLVALVATLLLAVAAPASASQTQLSGTAVFVGGTPELPTFSMSGSLVGTWYTDSVECHVTPGRNAAPWPCTGTEHFVGCLDANGDGQCLEPSGVLYFTYNYTGTPVGNGRCHHPIVSGTGAFEGATGQLTFKDRLGACGIVETTYKGHISLP
jgi:hypothetical protein